MNAKVVSVAAFTAGAIALLWVVLVWDGQGSNGNGRGEAVGLNNGGVGRGGVADWHDRTTEGRRRSSANPRRGYGESNIQSADVSVLREMVCDASATLRVRNDAADRLVQEGDEWVSGELIRMLKDEDEELTWRNYCIQFLRACYEQTPEPRILKALKDTCEHREPELSSCALWSMAQLAAPRPWAATLGADWNPRFEDVGPSASTGRVVGQAATTTPGNTNPSASVLADATEPGTADARHLQTGLGSRLTASLVMPHEEVWVREKAVEAVCDQKAHVLVRSAGVRSCALLGERRALPELRAVAVLADQPTYLRIACIAGLAELRDEEARPLLLTLARDLVPALRTAAAAALKRLDAPVANPATPSAKPNALPPPKPPEF